MKIKQLFLVGLIAALLFFVVFLSFTYGWYAIKSAEFPYFSSPDLFEAVLISVLFGILTGFSRTNFFKKRKSVFGFLGSIALILVLAAAGYSSPPDTLSGWIILGFLFLLSISGVFMYGKKQI